MSPWLRVLEAYAVAALLRTPAFHRAVEKVAKQVHRVRHGIPPDEPSGTQIDNKPGPSGFLGHFADEVKAQMGAEKHKQGSAGVNMDSRAMSHDGRKSRVEEVEAEADKVNADAAWRDAQHNAAQPPKRGLGGEYLAALREQMRRER
ncbi:hypothetical protein B0A50_01327 [Salinomyces thailandicus]|uniref:Uncharacterized protein n=1 Tax=Salinomyces thailandicus TaxID=706561 RepID=A0A4U0U9P1_9PEZI|nr:hypothetical protein B0A50_01327 [Salinomyces thailandica]